MIGVDQTIFGDGRGNCFQACVASVLELPLEAVPHVMQHDNWLERLNTWALGIGWTVIWLEDDETELLGARGYYIAGGKGPRNGRHACVYFDGQLVWDPHPSRAGLLTVDTLVGFMPLDPAIIREVQRLRWFDEHVRAWVRDDPVASVRAVVDAWDRRHRPPHPRSDAVSIFDGLFGGGDCGQEPSKDKSYHPEEHRYGFPGHSRDTKSFDGGSPTTGQTWSDLDPDGNGGNRSTWWWWMTRVDWFALRFR